MKRFLTTWLAPILVLFLAATTASAQAGDPFRRVEVHVTAVSGNTILIDRGSADGLAIGDALRLMPLGRPVIEGVIRTVSLSSSRDSGSASVSSKTSTRAHSSAARPEAAWNGEERGRAWRNPGSARPSSRNDGCRDGCTSR